MVQLSLRYFYHEFGLASVRSTGRDAILIILARCCRMIAYGTNALILALFFAELKFSDWYIGLFMSLTLVGDVILGLLLTLVADQVGRRRTLFAGSVLMVLSGATFAISENYWILLGAAVVGVISTTGGDFGPFRAIEESTLSQLTNSRTRSDVLSWYVTTASIGSCIGTEASGRVIEWLKSRDGWTLADAYHTCFWVYSVMGIVNMLFSVLLSSKCELPKATQDDTEESEELLNAVVAKDIDTASSSRKSSWDEDDSDSEPLRKLSPRPSTDAPTHHQQQSATTEQPPKKKSRFAQISQETRAIMYKLWFLLIVDSLADGMVSFSLTNYYMDLKFHLPKSTLGDISSVSYFLSSLSSVFAGPLARRLGLINTMVFTHLPSSAAVLLFALPQNVPLTVVLLLIRHGLNNMDQAPRSAFIAAVVRPEERTAVMGITSMLRTLASTTGPFVTGLLAGSDRFWIAFVAAGSLRIAYDLGLFAMFVNMKLHKHEEGDDESSSTALAGVVGNNDEEEVELEESDRRDGMATRTKGAASAV